MNRSHLTWLAGTGLAAAAVLCSPARADDVAKFYKGKTVTIVAGFSAGGGFDLYARLAASHWGRFLPGTPNFIVQNMPGAGSLKAARYLFNAASRDGTVIGIMLPHVVASVLMEKKEVVRPAEYNWLGRINEHISFAVVRKDAPAGSVAAAKSKQVIIGATAADNISATVAFALNSLIGTKFKVVTGYRGTSAMAPALERGEVEAVGAVSWELLNTRLRHWVADDKISYLWILHSKRYKGAPDVPSFVEFADDPADRAVLEFLGSGPAPGRSFAAPPKAPADRVAALRRAFTAMVADKTFLADAKKRKLDIDAAPGAEIQEIVARIVATPRPVIDKTLTAIKPK